jgi:hypothetical protein
MFQFLYPLGLLAAVGISIPVLIHLWNVKSGKTLKIGSVFLLGTPSNQRSRSLKLQDWPLLLLRCLLILFIAFLMAKPVYEQQIKSSERTGWVLVKKADFSRLWKQQHSLMDSLLKKGYEVHDFDFAFDKIDLKDTLTTFSRSAQAVPYYSLIRQLNSQHPQGTSMYVFTADQLADFQEQKPETHLNLHWNFLPEDSSRISWPALAYKTQSGSIRQLTGNKLPLGNYYVSKEGARPDENIQVDSSTMRVQIYADKNTPDASYVSSAVMAAADFTKRKIALQRINTATQISAKADLVFWLSDKKLSAVEKNLLSKPKVLFTYAGGKLQRARSAMADLSGISREPAALYRRTALLNDTLAPVWVDGTGITILGKTETKGTVRYEFYSRFRPEWTDLVWSEQMVSFLLPVFLPVTASDSGFRDKGKLSVTRDDITLAKVSTASGITAVKYKQESFLPWLWWILVLVFFVERWISYRKNLINT